jgi:arsenate reductase
MAEALLNYLVDGKFLAESAGYDPSVLNPYVIQIMQEAGIDISEKKSKDVFDLYRAGRIYRYVITVCEDNENERCPIFPGTMTQLNLPFKNPADFKGTEQEILDKVRDIRNQMEAQIKDFMKVALEESIEN